MAFFVTSRFEPTVTLSAAFAPIIEVQAIVRSVVVGEQAETFDAKKGGVLDWARGVWNGAKVGRPVKAEEMDM